MRSQSQIRHQLKQVTYRHLQKRLRALFKQRPDTCCHNREWELADGVCVNLCGVLNASGQSRMVPCDSRLPGCDDMARECPLWEPLKTKAQVKSEFHAIVQSGNRGLIAASFPDVAALMWVLDDPDEMPSEADVEAALEEAEDDEDSEPSGWWPSLRKKLGGG